MNKVTFICKRSGNTISFTNENDIKGLREHEGYAEVKDAQANETVKVEPQQAPTKKVLKLKPKTEMPSFLQE
jgi:hypothetical protein